ncbi:CAF17-like 4Fe-4S cluster assembly/insertion protein YgfZ [Oceanibacterium hippocampi]|uniref:tRNA-modifying protein YgfZ n=1 Tax=Oceanibacterium hippocampi TaxID=745714 RepID=A0A1Y5TRB4_9PROT|nr:hypothetical protein [Oceanibacterium hippocampi]SLN70088.1 tRNA-modifying protein YgfZ [Oceanibacterium hippocampi]
MSHGRTYTRLDQRGVIAVGGPEARSLLQRIVSNDVDRLTTGQAIYSALLTPQGKFLHDFFLVDLGETLLLDCEADRRDDLMRRLTMYRLRSRVTLEDATAAYAVFAVRGDGAAATFEIGEPAGAARPAFGGALFVDPRHPGLGLRAILPADAGAATIAKAGFEPAPVADYETARLTLGIPDGSRDITPEKGFLLENNFEELHGVDFAKGCYVGQELTTRTKHRGKIRKRLLRVEFDGAPPPPDTPLEADGAEVGEMRSGMDGQGLAMIRLERLAEARAKNVAIMAGNRPVQVRVPDWISLAEPADV